MTLQCPICHADVSSVQRMPFGEEIICWNCGTDLVFDYDEGYEGPSFWLVTKKEYEQ